MTTWVRLRRSFAATAIAGLAGAVAARADQLPVPWNGMDIGGSVPAGAAQFADGALTMTGGGAGISGTSDQFHFVYQSMTGDFALIARVTDRPDAGDVAQAGLMVRDALAATSDFVSIVHTPGHGVSVQYRTPCAPRVGSATAVATAPVWVRLVKRGTTLSGYAASDSGGSPGGWKKVGGDQPIASGMIYAGLCLTGRAPGASGKATFDHVSLSAGPQPALDDGVYTLSPASAPALALTAAGAGVGIAAPVGTPSQKWVFTGEGGGRYDVRPDSDRSLALAVAGGASTDGTKIVLSPDQGLKSERWAVVPNSNGTYGLVPECAPGSGLDDLGGNATPDATIDLWARWAGDAHTQWTITPAP